MEFIDEIRNDGFEILRLDESPITDEELLNEPSKIDLFLRNKTTPNKSGFYRVKIKKIFFSSPYKPSG